MKLLKQFIQQETVLTAAAVLAVVSAFFVPPDVQYLGYIDLRTLAILFSLMTVMAGLRRQGFFDGLGRALLSRTHSTFQLTLVLVGLCFFGSMFITNDVSLLTFVPFTFVVLSRLGADVRRSLLVPVVCMQTIAANLGSMLTPIGNPQNLYLYGKSGMSIGGFVLLMLPYTLVSLLLLLAWAALVCRKASAALSVDELVSSSASQGDQKIILLYLVLFAVCLLSVIRVLPYGIAFAAVLVCVLFADPHTLRAVDYSLLLTFVAFFIFIGNLGRIPAFSGWSFCRSGKPGAALWTPLRLRETQKIILLYLVPLPAVRDPVLPCGIEYSSAFFLQTAPYGQWTIPCFDLWAFFIFIGNLGRIPAASF